MGNFAGALAPPEGPVTGDRPPGKPRRPTWVSVVTALLVIALVVATVGWLVRSGPLGQLLSPTGCTATAAGQTVNVSAEQATNAATIAAVAATRGLPARAITIALATAYQESDLRNLPGGDRDSAGLFQQRPSQGWGSYDQVTDPTYAAGRFYDELVTVDGYRTMAVTDAAQTVQRSGFPTAYADHESDARVLASALSGSSPAAFTCTIRPDSVAAETEKASGLTPRAAGVRRAMESAFGAQSLGGFAPGGVSSGHIEGSAHYDGRAIDVFFRPYDDPAKTRQGWALAHWLVANADRLAIATVIYDDRIWTAARSGQGWRTFVPADQSTNEETAAIQRHLDHIHVDVQSGA